MKSQSNHSNHNHSHNRSNMSNQTKPSLSKHSGKGTTKLNALSQYKKSTSNIEGKGMEPQTKEINLIEQKVHQTRTHKQISSADNRIKQ